MQNVLFPSPCRLLTSRGATLLARLILLVLLALARAPVVEPRSVGGRSAERFGVEKDHIELLALAFFVAAGQRPNLIFPKPITIPMTDSDIIEVETRLFSSK